MKVTLKQADLAHFISYIGRIVDSKPSLPVLGNILVEAQKDALTLTATNLEVSMQITVPAEVSEKGVTTVPARTFAEFIATLQDDTVTLRLEGQILHVETKSSQSQFNTMNKDNFPTLPTPSGDPTLTVDGKTLKETLDLVNFSTGTDSSNPVFTGVYVNLEGDSLAFVSSDGFKLSRYLLKVDQKPESLPWIIPVKGLREVSKLINPESDEDVVTFYNVAKGKQILMCYQNVNIYTRLIDGEFPDYKAVIPKDYQSKAVLSFSAMKDALKQINIFARYIPGNHISLSMDKESQSIVLEATLSEVGSNKTVVPAKIEGDNLKLKFSSKILGDIFNVVTDGELTFEGKPDSASVIKIDSYKDYIHVVMPLSVT